ncbi:MAG: 2-oxo acid dehydrogenase subunit E2 [Opitutales bacterium]
MEIKLPSLGEGSGNGTVVNILVKEGDTVEKDQTLMEIESDKAVAGMPSPEAGTIQSIRVSENDEVSEGDVLAILEEGETSDSDKEGGKTRAGRNGDGGDDGDGTDEDDEDRQESQRKDDDGEVKPAKSVTEGDEPDSEPAPKSDGKGRSPAAPSIRRMARDLGIDLDRIAGSGRGGRIEIADLRAYVAQLEKRAEAAGGPAERARGPALPEMPDPAAYGEVETESLKGIRKTIAQRLSSTWPNIPQVTQFGEADLKNLLELKNQHEAAFEKKDARLTLTAILVALLPGLLERYPRFNASLNMEKGQVSLKKDHHIGLAVDTEQGLLVPVLRDAGKQSLLEIAQAIAQLAESARSGRLDKEAMEGGTFTLSNQGGLGGGAFTPIVRYPEVAILGTGRATERPVRDGDSIAWHPVLPLALSYDHRLIDGGDAARFMADLVKALEDPDSSLFKA